MQKQAYPYCIHGNYVGGCGPDYVCSECEFGDFAPTVNEWKLGARANYKSIAQNITAELPYVLGRDSQRAEIVSAIFRSRVFGLIRGAARIQEEIAEIRKWAENDDDPDWIYRRDEARRNEWDAAEAEDQFNSLPDYVLDGEY